MVGVLGGEDRLAASAEPTGASRRRHLGFFRGALGSHPGVLIGNWILPLGAEPRASGGRGEGPSGLGRFPTLPGCPGFRPIELIEKLPRAEKEQAPGHRGWSQRPTRSPAWPGCDAWGRGGGGGGGAWLGIPGTGPPHVPGAQPVQPPPPRSPREAQAPTPGKSGPRTPRPWRPLRHLLPGCCSAPRHRTPQSQCSHNSEGSRRWPEAHCLGWKEMAPFICRRPRSGWTWLS